MAVSSQRNRAREQCQKKLRIGRLAQPATLASPSHKHHTSQDHLTLQGGELAKRSHGVVETGPESRLGTSLADSLLTPNYFPVGKISFRLTTIFEREKWVTQWRKLWGKCITFPIYGRSRGIFPIFSITFPPSKFLSTQNIFSQLENSRTPAVIGGTTTITQRTWHSHICSNIFCFVLVVEMADSNEIW